MRSLFFFCVAVALVPTGCDSARPLITDPDAGGILDGMVQAPPLRADSRASQRQPPPSLDLGTGCGNSSLDGSLNGLWTTAGCPPDPSACSITRTTTIEGSPGYPASGQGHPFCAFRSAFISTTRLVVTQRSRVRVAVSTDPPTRYETSIRRLCFFDGGRCAVDGPNIQVMEAGEYTLELATEGKSRFRLSVDIVPLKN